ncbi:TRAP transporter permease [Alteribacillus bidgolensis]|uniref:TRAP transporter, 4TM/12TM fusion protein n=1 Tax=Alteribacillus bidgolensis TaxID=930129 RepID=A0A1G8QTQ7_9BACI|nr:TRAP transporter fused permease subunit [Alteribacillus bidgolensis]SDJ08086.1 TRAP transporter, 4TM/12TM fusion protein [Alteribacillus bidgolensis]
MEPNEKSRFRQLSGYQLKVWNAFLFLLPLTGICYILSLYNFFNIMIYREQYFGLFLAFVLFTVYLGVPATKNKKNKYKVPWYDGIAAVLGLVTGGYIAIYYPVILTSFGIVSTERLILSAVAVILILEALRRIFGWVLTGIVMFVIAYGFTAPYFPGALKGESTSSGQLLNYLYLDANSLLYMLNIASTMALAFIFLGHVLIQFKGGDMFNDLAISLFGRFRGGPAKISVVGSSFVGSMTGGPVSNVLLTGNMTIPLMKRSGYSKSESGAIESVASTGGLIIPPVMGIAAFLIAENLGISYMEVAIAAIVPAVLYYTCLFTQVDLRAGKRGLAALPKNATPQLGKVLKTAWILLPIFAVLITLLFIWRFPPSTGAIYTAILAFVLFTLQKQGREHFFSKVKGSFIDTGKTLLEIGIVLAAAGLIVGVVGVTGLGFNLAQSLTQVGEHGLFILLIASAAISIVLGMGMPAVAAYSMVAVLIAPSLIELGVPPIAAHMFVFYYSILSSFTPPIAVACFAASSIAKENPHKIGFDAVKLGIVAYIVPFLFVYSPSLLLGSEAAQSIPFITVSVLSVVFGCILLSTGIVGYLFDHLHIWKRTLVIVLAVCLFFPVDETAAFTQIVNVMGGLLGIAFLFVEWVKRKNNNVIIQEKNVEKSN